MSIFGGKAKIGQWDPGTTIDETIDTGKKAPGSIYDKGTSGDPSGAARQTLDPAGAGANMQGAHNTNMGDVSNAYHTSVVDPLKEAGRQFQDWKKGMLGGPGGAAGAIPTLGQLPQVTAPTPPDPLKPPTQSFAVPTIAGQQIQFSDNGQYGGGAGMAQQGLIQQLAAQSRGQGPSLAEQQLKQAQEANIAAVMAQMASARGGANPLMQRQAMQTSADIQAQTARDAATMRLQEQLQAQGLLGQVSGQAVGQGLQERQQDVGLATDQAGLNQQATLAGFGAKVDANKTLFLAQQQTQLAQANIAADYAKMGMTAQQAQQQAALDIEKLKVAAASGDQAAKTALMGGLMSGAGTILGAYFGGPAGAAAGNQAGGAIASSYNPNAQTTGGYTPEARNYAETQPTFVGPSTANSNYGMVDSDETLKTNITDGSENLGKMLSALSASEYEYKDKKHGEGRYTGPMAQELARTEVGKSMVKQGPDGLQVDANRAAMTALSAAAMLFERMKQLEAKKKGH